jgi:hypothetical protein
MSTPITPITQPNKNNSQAVSSLVLGFVAIALALLPFYSQTWTTRAIFDVVAPLAVLLAVITGLRGLRFAKVNNSQGRNLSVAGLALAGLGLLALIAVRNSDALRTAGPLPASLAPQPPQVFKGDVFTFTYPGSWQVNDGLSQQDFCKQPSVECLIAIGSPADGTNLNLLRYSLDQEVTLEELDPVLWAQFKATTSDVTLESKDAIELGGQPAIRRIFSMPSTNAPGGRAHLLQIYAVKGLAFYQFTVWAPNANALTQHRAEVDALTTSFQFTPGQDQLVLPRTWTPTPTLPPTWTPTPIRASVMPRPTGTSNSRAPLPTETPTPK